MKLDADEGRVVARLIAQDGRQIVALVYVWETGDLGLRQIRDDLQAVFIDPPIDDDILGTASASNSTKLTRYLARLKPLRPLKRS